MGEIADILDRILLRREAPERVAESVAELVGKFPGVVCVGAQDQAVRTGEPG